MHEADVSADLRRRARWRSHFWPGSGFALLGHARLACVGTLSVALLPATFLGLAISFRAHWIWLILASWVFYLCFYAAEQILCRSIAIFPGGEKQFLSRFLVATCGALYGGLLGVIAVFFLLVGFVSKAGTGMLPSLAPGDVLLFRKHVFPEDLRPGHLVFFFTSADSSLGKGGDFMAARILAVPGQQLAIEGHHYLVNGKLAARVGTPGKLRAVLDVPRAPRTLTVPEGCYFIVQDDSRNALDSRILSWAREPNLTGTRAIVLLGHAFAQEVE